MELYQKTSFKAAVLSLSLLTIMSGAGVAPGIHKVAEAFPLVSETVIKLVISFPPLFMIFAALLSGFLGQFIKHKTLIIIGLLLFIFGGVGAGYMNSIPMILLFRAILGIGTGLILPFSTGLIAACFDGNTKTRLMGYSSATNSLGAIIGNILAGILAIKSWKYMFHIYWLGALVLLFIVIFLNHLPETRKEDSVKEKLPGKVYLYCLYAFLTMMVFYLIITNLSFFIDERQLGSSRITGFLFAVSSFTMLLAGIMIPYFVKLKRFFVFFVFMLISLGLFGIAQTMNLPLMFLSVISAGFGLGLLFPYLLNCISKDVPKKMSIKAMSIGMAAAWFGQFVSPLFFSGISNLTGLNSEIIFKGLSLIIMTLGVIILLFTYGNYLNRIHKKHNSKN